MEAPPTPATTAPPAGRRRDGLRAGDAGVGGLLLMVSGTVATQLMALGCGIVTARLLGVEGRGHLALVVAVAGLVAKLTLGGSLPVAVAQLLARDHLSAKAAMRPLAARWALLGTVPSLVAAVYLYVILDDVEPGLRAGLALGVAATAYMVMFTSLLVAGLQGELASIGRLTGAGLLLQAPYFVVLVAAYLLGWEGSSGDVVLVFVVTGVIGLGLHWLLLKPRPPGDAHPVLDRGEVRRLSRANYVNAIGTIDGVGLDRNLVGLMLGAASLGLYSAATAVSNVSTMIGKTAASVLLPRLAAAQGKPEAQARLLRLWLPGVATIIVLVVSAVQLVLAPVIELAFGAEFAPAIACARWLVLADGLLGFRRVLITVLQVRGRGASASLIEFSLTALLVGGIVTAALQRSLVLVGVAIFVVGAVSCLMLTVAILLPSRRRT